MNPQETKPSAPPAASTSQAGQDATLAHMLRTNRPLTVETYAALNWPGRSMSQLGAEELASIPDEVKRGSAPSANLPPPPTREQFKTAEAFEESMGYWQSHVGRIKAMADLATRSRASRQESKSTDEK